MKMKMKRNLFLSTAAVLVAVLLVFALTACGSAEAEYSYTSVTGEDSMEDSSWEDDPVDEYDEYEDDQAPSVGDGMTAARVEEIYTILKDAFYEEYNLYTAEEATAEWETYDDEMRTLLYEQHCEIARELGIPVNFDEYDWIEYMNSDTRYNNLLVRSLLSLGNNDVQYLSKMIGVYTYQKGVIEGDYESLHDDILATADDLTVEYYTDTYLLCVGGNHLIEQMVRGWSVEEESFGAGGTITAVKEDDTYDAVKVSYAVNGANGVFNTAEFGGTDILPILRDMGAIDDSNTFLAEQIDICAVNVFDAEQIFVLSQEYSGTITIAVLTYDEIASAYVWDGQILTTDERCCFSKDNRFYYIDYEGYLLTV
jgi:hypothetical protein